MSIRLWSYMRYLSGGAEFTQAFYKTNKLVKAIKGEKINGFASIRLGGRPVEIRTENSQLVMEWFAERVAELELQPPMPTYLCCVPDSQCDVAAKRVSRIHNLAIPIENRVPNIKIVDSLRFKRLMPRSHETNMRNVAVLFGAMKVLNLPPAGGRVIILDDVCTTGSHVRAAAAHLQSCRPKELIAICAARTSHDNEVAAMKWECEELAEYVPRLSGRVQ